MSDTLSLPCRLFIMEPLGELLLLLLLLVLDFIIIIIMEACGALVEVCVATPLVGAWVFFLVSFLPIFAAVGAFVSAPLAFDVNRTPCWTFGPRRSCRVILKWARSAVDDADASPSSAASTGSDDAPVLVTDRSSNAMLLYARFLMA